MRAGRKDGGTKKDEGAGEGEGENDVRPQEKIEKIPFRKTYCPTFQGVERGDDK